MSGIVKTADFVKILEDCVAAWNRGDAEGVAGYYAEEMDYRDPNVPDGIRKNADFARYLRILFRRWPSQAWDEAEVLAHAEAGCFSACYHFSFGNPRTGIWIRGTGMDRLEFEGEKIKRNWVYLNADRWGDWMRGVGKKG